MNVNIKTNLLNSFQLIRKFAWMNLRKSNKLSKNAKFSVIMLFFIVSENENLLGIPACYHPEICNIYIPFIYTFEIKSKDIFTRNSLDRLISKNRDNIVKTINNHGYHGINSDTKIFITDLKKRLQT